MSGWKLQWNLPDLWQCAEVAWQQSLKTRAPVAGLMDFLRMQGGTEASYPGMPPLDEAPRFPLGASVIRMVCEQEAVNLHCSVTGTHRSILPSSFPGAVPCQTRGGPPPFGGGADFDELCMWLSQGNYFMPSCCFT